MRIPARKRAGSFQTVPPCPPVPRDRPDRSGPSSRPDRWDRWDPEVRWGRCHRRHLAVPEGRQDPQDRSVPPALQDQGSRWDRVGRPVRALREVPAYPEVPVVPGALQDPAAPVGREGRPDLRAPWVLPDPAALPGRHVLPYSLEVPEARQVLAAQPVRALREAAGPGWTGAAADCCVAPDPSGPRWPQNPTTACRCSFSA
jgi:hypothetical protein